jgi:hypothetical protein
MITIRAYNAHSTARFLYSTFIKFHRRGLVCQTYQKQTRHVFKMSKWRVFDNNWLVF